MDKIAAFIINLYPNNSSLQEEMERLLGPGLLLDYMRMRSDFLNNGTDSEYCPEDESETAQLPIMRNFEKENTNQDGTELNSAVFHKSKRANKTRLICSFCKNNGEREMVFISHNLKDSYGKILCPVLRNYTCPICHATGDQAHTVKYCPKKALVPVRILKYNY